MSNFVLYHGLGIRGYEHVRGDDTGGRLVFTIRQRREALRCSHCGSARVFSKGQAPREWRCVPLGRKPKTGDQRAIPPTGRVRQLCETLPRKHRWVFTAAGSTQHPGTDRQLSERRLLRSLKRVLKRLELSGHLHTFRHAFISKSLLAGIPEAVVRGWAGHVDQEILKIYTHVADQVSQSAMRKFDETQPSQSPSGKDAQE